MAERLSTKTEIPALVPAALIGWTGLLNGDTGAPVELVDNVDRTATITGTFGAGGSVTIQGSNDGTNWFPIVDPQGNAVTKTAASMELMTEAPRYFRPIVTAGDGTTSLTVLVLCRRN